MYFSVRHTNFMFAQEISLSKHTYMVLCCMATFYWSPKDSINKMILCHLACKSHQDWVWMSAGWTADTSAASSVNGLLWYMRFRDWNLTMHTLQSLMSQARFRDWILIMYIFILRYLLAKNREVSWVLLGSFWKTADRILCRCKWAKFNYLVQELTSRFPFFRLCKW